MLLELTAQVHKLRLCSTPYGNQRKITRNIHRSLQRGLSAQRLTAIRGKSQEEQKKKLKRVQVPCSTPYGNQRKITGADQSGLQAEVVLNALRQSEENHLAQVMPAKA